MTTKGNCMASGHKDRHAYYTELVAHMQHLHNHEAFLHEEIKATGHLEDIFMQTVTYMSKLNSPNHTLQET